MTIYANFFTKPAYFFGHPLLFLVLQLFEAGGVSKRIQPNVVKTFTRSGHTGIMIPFGTTFLISPGSKIGELLVKELCFINIACMSNC